jgi:hypothetical protein
MRSREEGRRSNVADGMALITGRRPSEEECDGLWALLDIGVYRMLTDLRGWSPQQYETWLADAIDRLLDGGRRR